MRNYSLCPPSPTLELLKLDLKASKIENEKNNENYARSDCEIIFMQFRLASENPCKKSVPTASRRAVKLHFEKNCSFSIADKLMRKDNVHDMNKKT